MTPEQKLVLAMQQRNIGPTELANAAGVDKYSLSKIKAKGEGSDATSRGLSREMSRRLAPHLGVHWMWFWDKDTTELPPPPEVQAARDEAIDEMDETARAFFVMALAHYGPTAVLRALREIGHADQPQPGAGKFFGQSVGDAARRSEGSDNPPPIRRSS